MYNINTYIRNKEGSQIKNPSSNFMKLEQEEKNKPNVSRRNNKDKNRKNS